MSEEQIDPDVTVKALFEDQATAELESYLARGRRFSELVDQQVKVGWINTARAWIASQDNEEFYTQMSDLAAEAKLREIDMPYDVVAGDFQIPPDADIPKEGPATPEVEQIVAGFSKSPRKPLK
jgi:hypothetical protein